MKRDLETAREIQSCSSSQPPAGNERDVAFATRPQNSVAVIITTRFSAGIPMERETFSGSPTSRGKVPRALLMATFQAACAPSPAKAFRSPNCTRQIAMPPLIARWPPFYHALSAEYDPPPALEYIKRGAQHPIVRRKRRASSARNGRVPLASISTLN